MQTADLLITNIGDGSYQFQFRRNRLSLHKATTLTGQGNDLASSGEYAEALEKYHEAGEIDPHDPDPVYQSGTCLLDKRCGLFVHRIRDHADFGAQLIHLLLDWPKDIGKRTVGLEIVEEFMNLVVDFLYVAANFFYVFNCQIVAGFSQLV